jgi:hypothetical protein
MKKLIAILCVALTTSFMSTEVFAQISNRVGPMLAFASGDIDETGIGVAAEFGVAQKVSIAPQLILYFPGNDTNLLEINFNANYYFFNEDMFEFYGLGGINFARFSYEVPGRNERDANTELGINLGVGTNFEVTKKVIPFAELRLTIGDFDQVVLGLGVKFKI